MDSLLYQPLVAQKLHFVRPRGPSAHRVSAEKSRTCAAIEDRSVSSVLAQETNNNDGSIVNDVLFENLLRTTGTGFSFQVGAIYKLSPYFRLGASYDSPTWYRIDEETVQNIDSNNADADIRYIADIINIFPQYRLQTPSKITGSALFFGLYSKSVKSFSAGTSI